MTNTPSSDRELADVVHQRLEAFNNACANAAVAGLHVEVDYLDMGSVGDLAPQLRLTVKIERRARIL